MKAISDCLIWGITVIFSEGVEVNCVNISRFLNWGFISGQNKKQESYPVCYKYAPKNVAADVLPNEHSNKMAWVKPSSHTNKFCLCIFVYY
jgi:hypothetical protein